MSVPKPPPGFTTLESAINSAGKPYDIIGVCVDYLEPAKSRGTDYTCQFVLHDPSWYRDRGMKFRFFNSSIDKLPAIKANGDVLILRNSATKEFKNQLIGMSNSTTTWVVLSGSSILESTCPNGSDITFVVYSTGYARAPAPTPEEIRYVKEIVRLENPANYGPPPKSTALDVESRMIAAGGAPLPRKDKYQALKDLTSQPKTGRQNFADLFGEVRKTWYKDCGNLELSLTDYTSNKLLYYYSEEPESRDGDEYGYTKSLHDRWTGPWGRMTITVLLFDAHADFARQKVKPGMYIEIKNCQIKLDSNCSRLEALCRGDREDMSKINVSIFQPHQADHDQRFKDLLKRRLEYEKEAKAKGLRFSLGKKEEQKKRPIDSAEPDEAKQEQETLDPKKQSKRQRKKAKQNPTVAKPCQTNQHVRCENINVPLKTIDSILDPSILIRTTPKGNTISLPFQNCAYKSKVRVVDYYPHDIADFSIPHLVSDYDAFSDIDIDDDPSQANSREPATLASTLEVAQSNPHRVRWEWRFFLVVEDAHNPEKHMALQVADQDGEYLLNEEASDLRSDAQQLAKLREKLFVLWGDLQERKEDEAAVIKNGNGNAVGKADQLKTGVKAQSRPFECFIKEYGVPLGSVKDGVCAAGYQRMFRLFGTSI